VIAIFLSLLFVIQKAPYVPPGAVEGTLQTIEGKPAIAIRVVAYKVPGSGNPDDNLNYFELERPVSSTQTDNDGHYSMMDLPPGNYYIMAGTAGQGTYYPNGRELRNAAKIPVKSNEITSGLDIRLLNRYGGKVSGRFNADMAAMGFREITITGPPLEDLVEVPIKPDGSFEIPQLPTGNYLVSVWPPPSGMPSIKIKVGDSDITGEELTPLPTQIVSGRIVVNKGPLPIPILLFETEKYQTSATINADGTFVAQLHSDTHHVTMNGLPIGYSLASVRVGTQDASKGIVVGNKEVTDVVITLNAPQRLAVIRGKITGLEPARYPATRVELTGPIVGALQASVRADGTFEFPAVLPGLYTLKLNSVPEFSSMLVAADAPDTFNVTVAVPSR
jgi:hypothetical protein